MIANQRGKGMSRVLVALANCVETRKSTCKDQRAFLNP